MTTVYPKRLIEIGLPIKHIAAHDWQPIVNVEHYRLLPESAEHREILKKKPTEYRTGGKS